MTMSKKVLARSERKINDHRSRNKPQKDQRVSANRAYPYFYQNYKIQAAGWFCFMILVYLYLNYLTKVDW